MMKWVLVVIAALLLAFTGLLVWRMFTPDEVRVQRLIEKTVNSFNELHPLEFVDALATDYRDQNHSLTRSEVRAVLDRIALDRSFRGPDGTFLYRARVPVDEIHVTLGKGKGDITATAEASLRATLSRTDRPDASPLWVVDVTLHLQKSEDEWKIASSHYETVSGGDPFH